MKIETYKALAAALLSAAFLAQPGCTSEAKAQAAPSTGPTITVTSGEAGGTVEETFSATVTVTALDPATRGITLSADDGTKGSFTAGPEIRNYDQLKVGDKVNATLTERMVIFVRSGSTDPSVAHAAAIARAPKGAKPGVVISETFEIVAAVKSIDTEKRTAALQFSDGSTKMVNVRPDVDLSKYKVGDSVVIRSSKALALLVARP